MATDRDQIVVLQHPIISGVPRSGVGSHANANFLIAQPFGRQADMWLLHRMRSHIATDSDGLGTTLWDPCNMWQCQYKAGAFYGEGANEADLSYVGWGAWASNNAARVRVAAGNDDTITLALPANASKVFIIGLPGSGGGLGTVTVNGVATSRTINFKNATQSTIAPSFGTSAAIKPTNWFKIADAADGTTMTGNLVVTTSGDGAANIFAGFLVVTSGSADPDVAGAVYDPDTLVEIMPDGSINTPVFYLASTATPTPAAWGCGHWAAAKTIGTPVETVKITDGTDLAITTSAWQRVKTQGLNLKRSGNLTFDTTVMGTWAETIQYMAGGMRGLWRATFNAAAVTAALVFASSVDGGYVDIFYLNGSNFDRVGGYPEFPGQLAYTQGEADEDNVAGYSQPMMAYGPGMVAIHEGWSSVEDGTPTRNATRWKWIAANSQIRSYIGTTNGELAVADGMVVRGGWSRTIVDRGGMEPPPGRRRS